MDPWERLKYFEGKWTGTGTGQVGESTVEREYEFILGGKFLQVKNRSEYPPQEANPEGEVHEDLGLYSFDGNRKVVVLRQFHVEGYVNQYVLESVEEDGAALVFVTEGIENIPEGFRARETLHILKEDEFSETFDLAAPGKEFACYIENRFRRVR